MADGYDNFDRSFDYHEGGGGSFVMGLLTGTVLGAGLGMLFAPRAGSELRNRISEQASEGYRRASESAGQWAERGRDVYNKASEAVNKGADEAKRYVRDRSREAESTAGSTTSPSSYESGPSYGGSAYGGSSESIRGSANERDTTTPRRP